MKVTAKSKQGINSLFSLRPLVAVLREMVGRKKAGAEKLYAGLLNEIEAQPELLQPAADLKVFYEHSGLVEALLAAIFPPSTIADGIYAVSFPFQREAIFASAKFKEYFLKEDARQICLPEDRETNAEIIRSTLRLAFNILLQKFYNLSVPLETSSVYPFPDPETGLIKYLELKLNAQYVDVKPVNEKVALPSAFMPQRIDDLDELREIFPLENFQFEGLIVIDVTDITAAHVILEIKNILLSLSALSDNHISEDLQKHVETLVELKDIEVGITPFFRMNDFYLYADSFNKNSLLFRNEKARSEKDRIQGLCRQLFQNTDRPVLFQNLSAGNMQNELVKFYADQQIESLMVCPLKTEDGYLIGLLEISAAEPDKLRFQHVLKLQSGMPVFSHALSKTNEALELQIDKTIKEHFTAIQSAVEWKFVEAAFDYLQNRQVSDSARMSSITFGDVYPLYGSIDIRNSSTERTNAIQLDLMEQLSLARNVLESASRVLPLDLLKELQFKIDKYIASTTGSLLSDEEMLIYDFLQIEVDAIFRHLKKTQPSLKKVIEGYFSALDPQRNMIYHHRKEYEDSITRINDVLDRFVDLEQKAAQAVYPHYFERYVTDGIEFNLYIGQSLAPQRPFDTFYIKNIKLWQLTMLAKASRLTHALEKKLSLPLQTTQLILTQSLPLSISFRRKERKFDVEGAYNIHYEIVKKRIDKVHIKNTEERLTQPGKVAIVYSQQKELNEYMELIEYLQHEGLLTDSVEHLELEDTQGISGLKAIRVDVNLEADPPSSRVQLSKVTSNHLLRK